MTRLEETPMPHPDEALLQAERRRIAAAFDPVLDEPVPERLRTLLAPAPAPVVDLASARARRRTWPSWAAWGGMAATLLLGTLLGTRLAPGPSPAATDAGELLATGEVAQALEHRLASDGPGAVAVQLSFKDRHGRYCRSFTTASAAGLACRAAQGGWALQQVAVLAGPAVVDGRLRQAASTLPPSLLAAVDAKAAGDPLNATQEREARDAGWRP